MVLLNVWYFLVVLTSYCPCVVVHAFFVLFLLIFTFFRKNKVIVKLEVKLTTKIAGVDNCWTFGLGSFIS